APQGGQGEVGRGVHRDRGHRGADDQRIQHHHRRRGRGRAGPPPLGRGCGLSRASWAHVSSGSAVVRSCSLRYCRRPQRRFFLARTAGVAAVTPATAVAGDDGETLSEITGATNAWPVHNTPTPTTSARPSSAPSQATSVPPADFTVSMSVPLSP